MHLLPRVAKPRQLLPPMPCQHPLRIAIRLAKRLTNTHPLQLLPACDPPPQPRERGLEGALSEPWQGVRRAPEQVGVGEVEARLAVALPAAVGVRGVVVERGVGAEEARVGEEEVGDELGVEGPVAGVVEDEDGVDF